MRVAVNFTVKNPGRLKVNPVVKINATVPEATKVSNKLIVGEKEYDGSEEVIITASDLGAITEVPIATKDIIGGISLGYITQEGSNNRPVQVDEYGKAYVTVPLNNELVSNVTQNTTAIVNVQNDVDAIQDDMSEVKQDITVMDSDLTEVKLVTDSLKDAITTEGPDDEIINYVIIDGGSAAF